MYTAVHSSYSLSARFSFFNTRPRSNVNSNLIQRKKAVNYLN